MPMFASNLMGDVKPLNPLLAGRSNHHHHAVTSHSDVMMGGNNPLMASAGRGRRNVRNGGLAAAVTAAKNPLMAAMPAARGHAKNKRGGRGGEIGLLFKLSLTSGFIPERMV